MTLKQFLVRLRKTPRDWRLTDQGSIRRARSQCPMSALVGTGSNNYLSAGEKLALPEPDVHEIAYAADSRARSKLRSQLLKACGLSRETTR